jgi:hypothetical protein
VTHPHDNYGRYLIPAAPDEPRIEAGCTCGASWNVPARAWDWISDRHAHAHNKGIDGLLATSRLEIRQIEAEPEAEAGL